MVKLHFVGVMLRNGGKAIEFLCGKIFARPLYSPLLCNGLSVGLHPRQLVYLSTVIK